MISGMDPRCARMADYQRSHLAASLLLPAAKAIHPYKRCELQSHNSAISKRHRGRNRVTYSCAADRADNRAADHRATGWHEHLASCALAASLAVAITATGCVAPAAAAAHPLPSYASIAAAITAPADAPPGRSTDGPLDVLQRQLREADRAITRQLRRTQQFVTDGWQSLLPEPQTEDEAEAARAEGAELIWEVWDVVDREYLDARNTGFDRTAWAAVRDAALAGPLDSPAAAHRAVRDMMTKGLRDPYSRFISPQDFEAMLSYDVSGVGLNLGTAEEFRRKVGSDFPPGREDAQDGVWVIGVIQGSAADAAGVQQGDELLRLDGESVSTLSPYQVSAALAGDESEGAPMPAQQVDLAVRDSEGKVREYTVPRSLREEKATVYSAVQKRPGGVRIGFLRIASFSGHTQVEVAQALANFAKEGVTAVDLDLRGNLGGLVNQGVEIARLFLDEGSIIVVKEEGRDESQAVISTNTPSVTSVPLTVLVDGDTASAAEILAGALQDNCRAILIGSRTYGKGLIQSIYELHDASGLALTVGRYRTPGGVDIDQTGIVPNFRGRPSPDVAAARLRACVPPSLAAA